MEELKGSLYSCLATEIKAFLPYVDDQQLEALDLEELFRLTAKARLVQEQWRDIFAAAIAKAFPG